MTKMFYCAVGVQVEKDGKIVMLTDGVTEIPINLFYCDQRPRVTTNSEGYRVHSTHIAYGLTEEDAIRRRDALGWQDYRKEISRAFRLETVPHKITIVTSTRKSVK